MGIALALAALEIGSFAAPAAQADAPAAFVEVASPRAEYFEREPPRLTIRFGIDRELLRGGLLQLSTRELDLPVQISAPWLDRAGPRAERRTDALGGEVSVAIGEGVGAARRVENLERDGRTLAVFEIQRTLPSADAGEIVLDAPSLRFTWSPRGSEDALGGGAPEDWRPALVLGEPLALRIRRLPENGRPPEFSGAVGRFTVRASAEPREVRAGESVRLALVVEGDGDLGSFAAPRLDRLQGFHLLGQSETRGELERTVVYDLAPASEAVAEIPAIAFSYFDTGELTGYRTAYTRPIPIVVRPRANAATAPSVATEGSPPGRGGPGAGFTAVGSTRVLVTAVLVAAAAALAVLAAVVVRRRRRTSS